MKVVIAIPTNGNDGREQLSGVFDWVNTHAGWEVQLIITRSNIINGQFEKAVCDADGVYLCTACENERIARFLQSLDVKMVVTDEYLVPLYQKTPSVRFLIPNNVAIGRDAAHYFNSLGRFASYGFVHGAIHYLWSMGREKGFCMAAPRKMPFFSFPSEESKWNLGEGSDFLGAPIFSFPSEENKPTHDSRFTVRQYSPAIPQDRLAAWLEMLPKPTAIFAANDITASYVLRVCSQLGLDVPHQIAVLGCDNDPLIFANTRPALSSLQLPFRKLGYRAAETLDKLLKGRKTPQRTILVSGTRLFARASSAAIPPATVLVERARTYIKEHACEGIRASDVVSYLGVSRSLLGMRFKDICGKSVIDEILDCRLAEVKRFLRETDRTILQIGRDCGFNDPDNLTRLFRKRYGVSMSEWRKKTLRPAP